MSSKKKRALIPSAGAFSSSLSCLTITFTEHKDEFSQACERDNQGKINTCKTSEFWNKWLAIFSSCSREGLRTCPTVVSSSAIRPVSIYVRVQLYTYNGTCSCTRILSVPKGCTVRRYCTLFRTKVRNKVPSVRLYFRTRTRVHVQYTYLRHSAKK